jgi:hypothetical protein
VAADKFVGALNSSAAQRIESNSKFNRH